MEINTLEEIDMFAIANRLNIKLRFWDEASEATRNNGSQWIFINKTLSPNEQWQDFGHELCHVLKHAGNQRSLPVEFRLYQEVKADNFMYHFCIPTFMLLNFEFPCYTEQAIYKIAQSFNVTIEFARRRFFMYQNKQQQHLYQKQLQLQLTDRQNTDSTEQIMDIEIDLEMGILPEEFYDFYDLSVNGEIKVQETIEFIKYIRKKEMR